MSFAVYSGFRQHTPIPDEYVVTNRVFAYCSFGFDVELDGDEDIAAVDHGGDETFVNDGHGYLFGDSSLRVATYDLST